MNNLSHDFKSPLIIAAMDVEERNLLQGQPFTSEVVSQALQMHVKKYQLASARVLTTKCGVGLLNAGLALALIAERHPIDAVILLGVGGALSPSLNVGDVVVSKTVIQHDSYASLDEGSDLMAPGELYLSLAPNERKNPRMPADENLVKWIVDCFVDGDVRLGTVLSGAEFVGTSKRKNEIASIDQDALLVDMEAAGVAQVARKLKLPFVVVKTVADRLRPDGTISNDYKAMLASASRHAGIVSTKTLKMFA